MNDFLKFIDEDIKAKTLLLSTMPTKTKRNIKKYNEKIKEIEKKYLEYKSYTKKYIDTKSRSLYVKKAEPSVDAITEKVGILESLKFLLNPSNTYFEKMGFDNLMYKINNYSNNSFDYLNDVINEFLDKFELIGIQLQVKDFNYTYFVQNYMDSFLEVRYGKTKNFSKVSKVFEKIYWLNPDLVLHIELNFRKLIKKNEKKFVIYISNLQKNALKQNNIIDFDDCQHKLKKAYIQLNEAESETIDNVISLSINGEININDYFEESKIRVDTFKEFSDSALDLSDKDNLSKFYTNIFQLRSNILEYKRYLEFFPLIKSFKTRFEKMVPKDAKPVKNLNLKNVEKDILAKEKLLDGYNRNISRKDRKTLSAKNEAELKLLKIKSVEVANELYELYKKYDEEYFNDKVLLILNDSITIAEILHLYYSFDYYKKQAIKKVFNLTTHEEVFEFSDNFDLFAMNPTNQIVKGILLFNESNIPSIISNKYRLNNIMVNEEKLNIDSIEDVIKKLTMLLRIKIIEDSTLSVDKIWFITQVEKINAAENK